MKSTHHFSLIALAVLSTFSVFNSQLSKCLAQGSLSPPGAPAPTMKSLDQIEPRTPISSLPFTIANPGSYCLTTNLFGSTGITINTNDVTIDLNGFVLAGILAVSQSGIFGLNRTNVLVRNGTIRNWGSAGINLQGGRNYRIEQLQVYTNFGSGILVGAFSRIVGCMSWGNPGGSGISSGGNSLIQDCVAFQNSQQGINLSGNCAVMFSVTSSNTQFGILVGDGCVVKDCVAADNLLGGISAGSRCQVTGCTAVGNPGGINVINDNLIVGNVCVSNVSVTPSGAGVFSTGTGNRIDGNAVNGNSRGIQLNGSGNLIIRNSARGNGTNYVFASGQTFGPTNNLVNAAGVITNQNPWVNFSY